MILFCSQVKYAPFCLHANDRLIIGRDCNLVLIIKVMIAFRDSWFILFTFNYFFYIDISNFPKNVIFLILKINDRIFVLILKKLILRIP